MTWYSREQGSRRNGMARTALHSYQPSDDVTIHEAKKQAFTQKLLKIIENRG